MQIVTIGTKTLLFALAAQAEYGPHLRARFTPLMTGVGPVEAAVALTAALSDLRAQGALPDLVVSLGSAGSRRLEQCGVYQVSSVSYRDMDASALGFEKGRTPFLDLPKTLPLPHIIPGIASASLSTGGNIISGAAYDGIGEDMVDMETFALLRACQTFGAGAASNCASRQAPSTANSTRTTGASPDQARPVMRTGPGARKRRRA